MRHAAPCFSALLVLVASAAPAFAQSPGFQQQMDAQLRENQLRALQDLAAREAVIRQNQLNALDAQLRAQQALSAVQAQSYTPQLSPPAGGTLPSIDTSALASIPDDKLAASNARVKAAAENIP